MGTGFKIMGGKMASGFKKWAKNGREHVYAALAAGPLMGLVVLLSC